MRRNCDSIALSRTIVSGRNARGVLHPRAEPIFASPRAEISAIKSAHARLKSTLFRDANRSSRRAIWEYQLDLVPYFETSSHEVERLTYAIVARLREANDSRLFAKHDGFFVGDLLIVSRK